ncbi:hypothetical protein SAY87_011757 [Trapa incisa]|uniref:Rho termination factor-like N-terminal domain-containing protein n=1 Tax=Trapa incisa TaxID=236973 RepID=A0AAN7GG05_9MYRT|nr:hypothetical protein SAY87_011757 [Trapa incisa]
MDFLLLHPLPTASFPAFSSSVKQPLRLRNPNLSLNEISVVPLVFNSKEQHQLQLVTSSIKFNGSKGGRSPRKNSASRRIGKQAQIKQSDSLKGKVSSTDQEEIISLFRRIHSSILEGGSEDSKTRSSDSPGVKPATESVLEIIRSSRKQSGGKLPPKDGSKQISPRSLPKGEKGVKVEDYDPATNFVLTRPPSNFLKRSPISYPSSPRRKESPVISEESQPIIDTAMPQLKKLQGMKLVELKEQAKSRGIKGYSKLKKKELIKLLSLQGYF